MSHGLLLSALEAAGHLCAFERETVYLKDACKAELGKAEGGPLLVENPPEPGTVREHESPAWYAAEILAAIERVCGHIAGGDASKAAAETVTVGELAAELDARYDSPAAKAWRAVRRGGSMGSKEAQRTKQDAAAGLLRVVDELLAKDPHRPRRDIARELLPLHGRYVDDAKPGDNARAVNALAARIRRAEQQRRDE